MILLDLEDQYARNNLDEDEGGIEILNLGGEGNGGDNANLSWVIIRRFLIDKSMNFQYDVACHGICLPNIKGLFSNMEFWTFFLEKWKFEN